MNLITRRRFIIGCSTFAIAGSGAVAGGGAAAAAAAVPPNRALAFQIVRKGSVIGSHRLDFEPSGDALTIRIAVEIVVKLGPIPVYRYNHRNVERWQAGQFLSTAADTNDDGDKSQIRIQRRSADILVEGGKGGPYTAPSNALAATHWNMAELAGPMINPQNGQLLQPTVTRVAAEGKGGHFALSGDMAMELWYDDDATWTSLAFKADDGSILKYERVT